MQSSALPGSLGGVLVQHRVPGFSEEWLVGEPVPEAAWHDDTVELLKALLVHFVASTARDAAVFRNLAIRVREDRPNVGFDPDLAVVEPAPPRARDLSSLKLWEPGHSVPRLVLEVVSPGHAHKDYADIPDRCAALGVHELVVFDPKLCGPRALGGPKLLQVWRRTGEGVFTRVAEGDGPFPSVVLGGYFVVTDERSRLRIAHDAGGGGLWLTGEEAERARADAERIERDRALSRIAALEAELRRR